MCNANLAQGFSVVRRPAPSHVLLKIALCVITACLEVSYARSLSQKMASNAIVCCQAERDRYSLISEGNLNIARETAEVGYGQKIERQK